MAAAPSRRLRGEECVDSRWPVRPHNLRFQPTAARSTRLRLGPDRGIVAPVLRTAKIVVTTVLLTATGCASMDDVQRGTGRSVEIQNRSYEEIWRAALRVADAHFTILEQDQQRGIIHAERTMHFMGEWGDWVGIFITPSHPGAGRYVVEVVKRKKLRTQVSGQDWERKIPRDLLDVLDGRPMR